MKPTIESKIRSLNERVNASFEITGQLMKYNKAQNKEIETLTKLINNQHDIIKLLNGQVDILNEKIDIVIAKNIIKSTNIIEKIKNN